MGSFVFLTTVEKNKIRKYEARVDEQTLRKIKEMLKKRKKLSNRLAR